MAGEPRDTAKVVREGRKAAFDPPAVQAAMLESMVAAMVGEDASSSFGRYALGPKLGSGGMGTVHSATDTALGREVAIKLLRVEGAASLARLRSEAASMAAVSHPNVIDVYAIDERDGSPYIVMERIHGPTLRAWLCDDVRTGEEVLSLMTGVGRGLAAMHGRSILHRDVKPSNILVDPLRGGVVIDFGLSRVARVVGPDESTQVDEVHTNPGITETGVVVGTRSYMAPEQRLGDGLGPHTDQWTFALVLWEALFGARPQHPALDEVPVPMLPWGAATGLVPPRVKRALLRALDEDPTRRWPSMAALLDALQPGRRRRWILGAVLAAVAGVVAVRPPTPAHEAVRAGFGLLHASVTLGAGRRLAASADPDDAVSVLEAAFFSASATGDDVAAAEAAASLADVLVVERQDPQRARDWLDVLGPLLDRASLDGTWRWRAAATRSKILLFEGEPQQAARVAHEAAAQLDERPDTPEHRRLREALLTSAAIASEHLGRPDDALTEFRAAHALATRVPAASALVRARLKFNVLRCDFYRDPTRPRAERLATFAREVERDVGEGILLRHVRGETAAALATIERDAEAAQIAGQLIDALPADDVSAVPIEARARLIRGSALARTGHVDRALEELSRSVALHEQLFGADHFRVAHPRQERARALTLANRNPEALREYDAILELLGDDVWNEGSYNASIPLERAGVLRALGRTDEADAIYDRATMSKGPAWVPLAGEIGLLTSRVERGAVPLRGARQRLEELRARAVDSGTLSVLHDSFVDAEASLQGRAAEAP